MIRLEDIAKATGYSLCAVSQVLRGRGNFSDKTRKIILNSAGEMNYQVNGVASLLAQQRHRSRQARRQLRIAAILGRPLDAHNGFTRACHDFGYDGECIDPNTFKSPQQMVRILWNRGFSGLVLEYNRAGWSEDDWLAADWSLLSVVKGIQALPQLDIPVVCHSAFNYMLFTLRQVFQRGYRRMAVLLVASVSESDDIARKGAILAFADELRKAGGTLQFREITIPQFKYQMDPDYRLDQSTYRWLRRFKPDAVIGFPHIWIYALKFAGFRIPEEIGFASPISSDYFKDGSQVCGADPQYESMEYRMVELLHALIQVGARGLSPRTGSLQDVVMPKWVECETLPNRALAKQQSPVDETKIS